MHRNGIRPNDDDESENDVAPSAGLYRNMACADDIGLATTEICCVFLFIMFTKMHNVVPHRIINAPLSFKAISL